MFPLISYPRKTPRCHFPWLFFERWFSIASGPVSRWSTKGIQKSINEIIFINTSYRESSQVVNDLFLLYRPNTYVQRQILCLHKCCSNRKEFHRPVSKVCSAGTWLSPFTAVKVDKRKNASSTPELYPERGGESFRAWFLEGSNTHPNCAVSHEVFRCIIHLWPFGWLNTQGSC